MIFLDQRGGVSSAGPDGRGGFLGGGGVCPPSPASGSFSLAGRAGTRLNLKALAKNCSNLNFGLLDEEIPLSPKV
ncbi:MAG: hypothetical protein IPI60_18395 [Saprospiraceae bacterium]|nr:hypothetical protein [Saprospiraceae bacterium]